MSKVKKIMYNVDSSVIDQICYLTDTRELFVKFNSGSVYEYFNVPIHVVNWLMSVDSVGSFFCKYIRNSFTYVKLVDVVIFEIDC